MKPLTIEQAVLSFNLFLMIILYSAYVGAYFTNSPNAGKYIFATTLKAIMYWLSLLWVVTSLAFLNQNHYPTALWMMLLTATLLAAFQVIYSTNRKETLKRLLQLAHKALGLGILVAPAVVIFHHTTYTHDWWIALPLRAHSGIIHEGSYYLVTNAPWIALLAICLVIPHQIWRFTRLTVTFALKLVQHSSSANYLMD